MNTATTATIDNPAIMIIPPHVSSLSSLVLQLNVTRFVQDDITPKAT